MPKVGHVDVKRVEVKVGDIFLVPENLDREHVEELALRLAEMCHPGRCLLISGDLAQIEQVSDEDMRRLGWVRVSKEELRR
jgi:hypothetical protein